MLAQREKTSYHFASQYSKPGLSQVSSRSVEATDLDYNKLATSFSPVSQVKYLIDCVDGGIHLFNDRNSSY